MEESLPVQHTNHLAHEKGQANSNGSDEGALVLLSGKHEDGKDELGGEEHFDEQAADNGGAAAEGGADALWAGEEGRDDAGGGDGAQQLGDDDHDATNPGNSADQTHAESNLEG